MSRTSRRRAVLLVPLLVLSTALALSWAGWHFDGLAPPGSRQVRAAERAGDEARGRDDRPSVDRIDSTEGAPLVGEGETATLDLEARLDRVPEPEAGVAETLAPRGLRVQAHWADGTPAVGEVVQALCLGAPDMGLLLRAERTDETGIARFLGLKAGEVLVRRPASAGPLGSLDAWESTHLFEPEADPATVELTFEPGFDIEGRVLSFAGEPVPEARVWLSEERRFDLGSELVQTDSDGRFRLRHVLGERALAARAAGCGPSARSVLSGRPGTTHEVTLRLGAQSAALKGVVRGSGGQPLADVLVVVRDEPGEDPVPDGGLAGAPPLCVRTDAAGRFDATGLAPGWVGLKARHVEHGPLDRAYLLEAGAPFEVELELDAPATISGHVRGPKGASLARVRVSAGLGGVFEAPHTYTDEQGAFRLVGLAPGAHRLRASHPDLGETNAELTLVAGESATWEVALALRSEWLGRLLDHGGAPLAGWHLTAFEAPHVGLGLAQAISAEDGSFRLEGLPETPFQLAVRSPSDPFGPPLYVAGDPSYTSLDTGDASSGHTIVLPPGIGPGATVAGRLSDLGGSALRDPRVICVSMESGERRRYDVDAEGGAFELGPLPAGEYRLEFLAQGLGSESSEVLSLGPGERVELGTVELVAAGRVVLQLVPEVGVPAPGELWIRFLEAAPEGPREVLALDPLAEFGAIDLAPGEYTLRMEAARWHAQARSFELLAGEDLALELRLEPATGRWLFLPRPARFEPPARWHVRVARADGELVFEEQREVEPSDEGYALFVGGLVEGTYTVEGDSDTSLAWRAELVVDTLDLDDRPRSIDPVAIDSADDDPF